MTTCAVAWAQGHDAGYEAPASPSRPVEAGEGRKRREGREGRGERGEKVFQQVGSLSLLCWSIFRVVNHCSNNEDLRDTRRRQGEMDG